MNNQQIEHTKISQFLQRVTIKIVSPIESGSGVIYKPSLDSSVLYILTSRHVVFGEGGLPHEVLPHQISLHFLFRQDAGSPFGEYQLKASDQIIVSDNLAEDFTVLLVQTNEIEAFTGELPCLEMIQETFGIKSCLFRGFPEAYKGGEPVRMEGEIVEPVKNLLHQFEWEVPKQLADLWISKEPKTAFENVSGFSGSGVFLINDNEIYLFGVVSKFGPFNRFIGEKASLLEALLTTSDLPKPKFIIPEVHLDIRTSVQRLKRNTNTEVTDRISNTIGGTWHLPRLGLMSDLATAIESNPITIVHGEAGAGKSVSVKDCVSKEVHHLLAFKGEQICQESLSNLLRGIGIEVDQTALFSSPLLEGRVIVWIDGAEKCVERNQFETLFDFVRLIQLFPEFRLVITIRKYALEHFRLPVLTAVYRKTAFFEVPLLNQQEQNEVALHFPNVKKLFDNPKLRRFLAVPFYLNFAVLLNEDGDEPLDQHTFKEKIWMRVIDKGKLRRSEVFAGLALKRAREMALYVRPETADWAIIEELEHDQVLVREDGASDRYAPAHDIFEDWALVRFVRHSYRDSQQSASFFSQLGSTYAIRRGFRFWLQEEIKQHPEEISRFATTCLGDNSIAQYWKDETFIALIQSDEGGSLLEANKALLLSDNSRLLLRFIHLFRTACKEPAAANPTNSDEPWRMYSTNYLPVGSGWGVLILFLHKHLENIPDNGLVYSFLNDWSKKLVWGMPLPDEAREAGLISLSIFWRLADRHKSGFYQGDNELRKGTLFLAFRLTKVINEEVKELLEKTLTAIKYSKEKSEKLEGMYGLIWDEMLFFFHCREVCIFFPDLVMEAAWEKWIDNTPILHTPHVYGRHRDYNRDYGLVSEHGLGGFPASAYQTPVLWLLRFHPAKTLIWIVKLMNYVAQIYANSDSSNDDQFKDVQITLNDGRVINQLGNYTFYQMFRGTGRMTPEVLQSVLMALEKWLFECASAETKEDNGLTQSAFDFLLNCSETVATSSVLISLAMAYPEVVGNGVFPLLRTRDFYQWDSGRMIAEINASAPRGAKEYGQLYQDERFEANQMGHRKKRLEDFVVDQFSRTPSFMEQMFPILDKFWKDALEKETDWRFCLNRMDIRKWERGEIIEDEGKQYVTFQPGLEEDLLKISHHLEEERAIERPILSAKLWAHNVFKKNKVESQTFSDWQHHYNGLQKAEKVELTISANRLFAPALLAAVGVRDFFKELDKEQLAWCEVHLLIRAQKEVEKEKKNEPWDLRSYLNPFEDVPSLFTLVLLLRDGHDPAIQPQVIQLLFESLLSIEFSNNLKNKFFDYVRENLWTIDRQTAYACWAGLIDYAHLWQGRSPRSFDPYSRDKAVKKEVDEFEEAVNSLTKRVVGHDTKFNELPSDLTRDANFWLDKALCILPMDLQEPEFRAFVEKYLSLLMFETLEEDGKTVWGGNSGRFTYSHSVFSDAFARFIYSQPREIALPLFDLLVETIFTTEIYKEDTFEFINSCIEKIMTGIANGPKYDASTFGFFWKHLLDKSLASNNVYFASLLLLESPNCTWNDNVINWEPIQKNKSVFIEIIQKLGDTVPNSVIRLIGGIGSGTLLPDGILWVHKILISVGTENIRIYDVEKLLTRIWVSHARQIRQDQNLLKNLIGILDIMVEKGSSLAFFMRESMFG